MRFEIRTGGAFTILIGLLALSGAVFALGLVAGYEMARQNQPDPSQLATVYPLPPAPVDAPPVQPAPSAGPSPAVASAPSPVAAVGANVAARPMPSAAPSPAAATPPSTVVSPLAATTSPPAAPKGKGYNIQIGGAMDRAYADEMVGKIKALGYQPYTVEMIIDGKKWYRVRVGPFASEHDAHAAQDRLKDEYRSAYAPN
ncbi:MAG: SPOR domain-containing protein [Candidatus Binataceae bacterium]